MKLNDIRSIHFIPANRQNFLENIINDSEIRPDSLIFDLEDGVLPEAKDVARQTLIKMFEDTTKIRDYHTAIRPNKEDTVYFKKDKIFLSIFLQHLYEKEKWQERIRRLRFFKVAIELIENSRFEPNSKENPNKRSEILHRFTGITKDDEIFYVQIKEDKSSGNKYLISFFPER